MKMRQLNVGCFGGGTGLPSLLGGLKNNPWLHLNAVVTMFDSGGSSGQLRDELGVLPPGDVLKCALALARNEAEARRVLLSRVPSIDRGGQTDAGSAAGTPRLAGHTGGNLLLSMMEQYSGDFLSAVDGLRSLLGCSGHVWPVSVERASVCAEYSNGVHTRGEVEVDRGQSSGQFVKRIWLEPAAQIHPAVAGAIRTFDAVLIGPGSFYTSLMPIFLVEGVRDALQDVRGPVILIANLLTEGSGMNGFTAGDAVRQISDAIGRPVDVVIHNAMAPSEDVLARYAAEEKHPLELGRLPAGTELLEGDFWQDEIAQPRAETARSRGVARLGQETSVTERTKKEERKEIASGAWRASARGFAARVLFSFFVFRFSLPPFVLPGLLQRSLLNYFFQHFACRSALGRPV